jgi:RNA polymerase sigma-70 factor (ECF subfamily)
MTDWSQVVQEHGGVVWRTAYRLLNHEADAADCFQNTFISAWEVSQVEPVRNWPGLLRQLATARAIERLRQRRRESERLTELADAAVIPSKDASPGQIAETQEWLQQLRMALAEIDDRQAQVFCLACLEEIEYREIARVLGVTVNHVGVLLHRAKAALRARLGPCAPTAQAGLTNLESQP